MNAFDKIKYIEIETHSGCTRKCQWCLFGAYPDFRPYKTMCLDTRYIESVLRDLKRNGFRGMIGLFSINEPLLDKRIVGGELIGLCRAILGNDVLLTITTNGDLLSKDLADYLFAGGLDQIKVSCYEKARYEKMLDIFSQYNNVIILDQTRYNDGLYESNRAGSLKALKTKPNYSSCYFPEYRTVIGWDGGVRICYHDILQKIKIGCIKEEKLSEILNGDLYIRLSHVIRMHRQAVTPCCSCNVRGHLEKMLCLNNEVETKLILKTLNSDNKNLHQE